VFAQKIQDWELILVDDGSTDSSTDIARGLSERNPQKISYLAHPGHCNKGTSASRNAGLRYARGELVAFLDADDVWMPDMLKCHMDILECQPQVAMSYGPGKWWYSWAGHAREEGIDRVQDLGVRLNTIVHPPSLVELFMSNEGVVPIPSGMLIRREVLLKIGGWEDAFVGMYDDQVLYVKIALLFPVYVTAECLYYYRQHEESLCAQAVRNGQYYAAREEFFRWVISYLKQYGDQFDAIRKLADSQLWFARVSAAMSHPLGARLSMAQKLRRISTVLVRLAYSKGPLFLCHPTTTWLAKEAAGKALPGWFKRVPRRATSLFQHTAWRKTIALRQLFRPAPVSRMFGLDRGLPINRHYIERFLSSQELGIQGCVLEIGDDNYTKKFGGGRVTKNEVLHVVEGNPKATIVADLTCADHIPSQTFDCIICTQTLQFIYEVPVATRTLHRILKPGGVLLATFSGISQISRYGMDRWGDYWRFTDASARRLFDDVFGPENVDITVYGNVLVACAYLYGLAAEELRQEELDYYDPEYQVLITVRATKA